MEKKDGQLSRFPAWLDRQIKSHGISRRDAAARIGVDPSAVSRWIRGDRSPSPMLADHIADAFHVDVDVVLEVMGARPADYLVDPESPEGQLIPLVRKVVWTEERLEATKTFLRFYIDRDEENRKRAKRSGLR